MDLTPLLRAKLGIGRVPPCESTIRLVPVAGLRDSPQRPGRGRREIRVRHLRAARCGPPMTGDLQWPGGPDVNDDNLLVVAGAMDPHPHGLAEQVVRDRVLGAVVGDRRRPSASWPERSSSLRMRRCAGLRVDS